jgi:hypothetical protein
MIYSTECKETEKTRPEELVGREMRRPNSQTGRLKQVNRVSNDGRYNLADAAL